MCWENSKVVRQSEKLLVNRLVKSLGAAFLKVSSATTADHKRVTGEHDALLMKNVTHATCDSK